MTDILTVTFYNKILLAVRTVSHPLFTRMNNKTIVLKQKNPQTHNKVQDPIPLLFERHKCVVPMLM